MKKGQKIAGMCLILAVLLGGCSKKETGEVAVPEVQIAEQETGAQPAGEETAPLELDTAPGTVLGQEEVAVMKEGEMETLLYTRVQGMEGVSAAYSPERFSVEADESELCFTSLDFPEASVTISEVSGDSAEGLADQYVSESNEECTVEETTVGEGEYMATWVGYSTGTDSGDKTCDIYVLRHGEKLYVARIDCTIELTEGLGQEQYVILSTLRFDEG